MWVAATTGEAAGPSSLMSSSSASTSCASVAAEGSRVAALSHGVHAVVEAMAGEVQFTNHNERAFALFRKGCRHCAQLPSELEGVGPKETIVAFLSRVAVRRSAGRQLQELGAILVQVAAWRDLLAEAPAQLREVLANEAVVLAAFAASRRASATPAPAHEARIFLREVQSTRFLTIAENPEPQHGERRDVGVALCLATERAASLFVVYHHHRAAHRAADETTEAHGGDSKQGMSVDDIILGFAHEGVPGLGCFLSCQRPRRRIRDVVKGGGDPELCCVGREFGHSAQFRWGADAAIQHVSTGLWLCVDPLNPTMAGLHPSDKSFWEVLPAV